ncbi:uncharacterized protein METZ01_LOCUS490021, partial [marine metagenome]
MAAAYMAADIFHGTGFSLTPILLSVSAVSYSLHFYY